MGYYIGGTEQSIVYDFGTKVANSVADCPLKVSWQMVDPNNLPNPTTGWTEITSQSTLDKLKSQNEIPLTSVNTSGRTAVYNGRNLVVQSGTQPAIKDDFLGKVKADTLPMIAKFIKNSALQNPSVFSAEVETTDYTNISTQNSIFYTLTTLVNGEIPQVLISIDLIKEIESKYGTIPSVDQTVTGKIAWIKTNLSSINIKSYACGIGGSGNKVYFKRWSTGGGIWTTGLSNTASTPTLLDYSGINPTDAIDSNGFTHTILSTDACGGQTTSTIIYLPSHGLSTDDMIVNNTRGNTITFVDFIDNNSIFTDTITGQVAGDSISKYKHIGSGVCITGTSGTTVKITAHGLSVGDYLNFNKWYKVLSVVDSNTLTVDQTGLLVNDSVDLFHFSGTQTAIDGVSQINTDYVSVELQFKSVVGYDLLVDQNPRRDSGLSNMVLLQKIYSQITDDYTGKVSGSNTVCANLTYSNFATSLISPSGTWYERGQTQYNNIMTLNGVCTYDSNSTNGNIPQQLFSINIVRAFEDAYGTIPIDLTGNSATDLTNKIQWLRDNLNTATLSWYGYGSYSGGSKAYLDYWNTTNSTWDYKNNNTASSKSNSTSNPSLITIVINNGSHIDANGMMNFIAYTEASNGTASSIYTDYVKMDLTFKSPNNSMLYFTNNSVELESLTNGKSQALLVEVDLNNVATSLYGGSNSALKSAIKQITTYAYAMGSGVLNGALSNILITKWWYSDTSWMLSATYPNTQAITTLTSTRDTSTFASNYITSGNKLYMIIYTANPSDSITPSQISLDYFQAKVVLSRTADNIPSNKMPTINIPSTWSYFMDINWSHYYGESVSKDFYFWTLFKDVDNIYAIKVNSYISLYFMKKVNGGSWQILQSVPLVPILKYQNLRLLVEQTPTGMRMRGLLNNGTVFKYTNTDVSSFTGNCYSVPLSFYNGTFSFQADAFLNNEMLMLNKNWNDDSEALTILNGTKAGFQLPELLDKTLSDTQTVNVYPNNLYQLTTDKSVTVSEYYNNILLKQTVYSANATFITSDKTNKVKLDTSGSFSTLSLKIKMN